MNKLERWANAVEINCLCGLPHCETCKDSADLGRNKYTLIEIARLAAKVKFEHWNKDNLEELSDTATRLDALLREVTEDEQATKGD